MIDGEIPAECCKGDEEEDTKQECWVVTEERVLGPRGMMDVSARLRHATPRPLPRCSDDRRLTITHRTAVLIHILWGRWWLFNAHQEEKKNDGSLSEEQHL